MNIDGWARLVEGLTSLAGACGWPLVVLFLLVYFNGPLKKFVENLGEFSLKAGASGLEATAKRREIEAAAALGAATAKQKESGAAEQLSDEDEAREIVNVVSRSVEPRTVRRLDRSVVLWVDDTPSNNVYERRALEALGVHVTLSTSTEDALQKLQLRKYDAVISDMSRPPDNQAGYTLLEQMRRLGIKTPFIIYAGSNRPEYKAEATRKGAFGLTNSPQELFELVVNAISNG